MFSKKCPKMLMFSHGKCVFKRMSCPSDKVDFSRKLVHFRRRRPQKVGVIEKQLRCLKKTVKAGFSIKIALFWGGSCPAENPQHVFFKEKIDFCRKIAFQKAATARRCGHKVTRSAMVVVVKNRPKVLFFSENCFLKQESILIIKLEYALFSKKLVSSRNSCVV